MNSHLTRIRKEILNIVESSERPLNVKNIQIRLRSRPDLSTVYRALEYLEQNGYIQFLTLGRTRYYFQPRSSGCGHFLTCSSCHEIMKVQECVSESVQEMLEARTHYEIHRHVLFFEGICPDCQVVLRKRRNAVSEESRRHS